MNTVFEPSSIRSVGRHTGDEVWNVWQEAGSASPRDHLEFGAKLLGFSAEVGDCAGLADQSNASHPQALVVQAASSPCPVCTSAIKVDVVYVSRGAKPDLGRSGSREVLPPRDSIDWQQLIARRIGYISAAFASMVTVIWLIWIIRGFPRTEPNWVTGLGLAFLILPALYGLFSPMLDAVYGMVSGATRRMKKYMDQVYPPSKVRR